MYLYIPINTQSGTFSEFEQEADLLYEVENSPVFLWFIGLSAQFNPAV